MDLQAIKQSREELINKILNSAEKAGIDLSYIARELLPNIVPTDSVSLDPNNTNKHQDLIKLQSSLINYGFRSVINCSVVNGHLVASAGNGRLMVAKRNGWPFVPVNVNDDDNLKHTQYSIIDNITGIPDFDWEILQRTLTALEEQGELNTTVIDGDFLVQVKEHLGEFDSDFDEIPNLDQLQDEYGEPQERDFWPYIKIQVSPETYQVFNSLMARIDGEDEAEKFEKLLGSFSSVD